MFVEYTNRDLTTIQYRQTDRCMYRQTRLTKMGVYSHIVWTIQWLEETMLLLADSTYHLRITEFHIWKGTLTCYLPQ